LFQARNGSVESCCESEAGTGSSGAGFSGAGSFETVKNITMLPITTEEISVNLYAYKYDEKYL
jgi:hypothetical protein